MTKGAPTIMKHFDTLIKNGKTNTYPALRGENGHYEALYKNALPLKGKYGEIYKKGWELYVLNTIQIRLIKFNDNTCK